MNPNHQDTILSSKYGEESWDTNASVNNWLDDLATGTEIIIKIRWLSHALYYSLDSRLCCSFSFTHQTDPIPNLSLDMATLSLSLWSNIKPKKLVIHLSGDWLHTALLWFTAKLSEAGLFFVCEKTSPSNLHIGPSPLNKHDVYYFAVFMTVYNDIVVIVLLLSLLLI